MANWSKTRFLDAVRSWQAADVRAALRERPELATACDSSGRPPLHVCARRPLASPAEARASIATAQALLDAGTDVNVVQPIPDDGEVFPARPLWCALAFGHNRPLGQFLLKQGADPSHCLFAMVWADDLPNAKLVHRYGAELDEVFGGETPLIYAIRHERVSFATWLLRQGAKPNLADRRGLAALHHAIRKRLPDSLLRLLVRCGAGPLTDYDKV